MVSSKTILLNRNKYERARERFGTTCGNNKHRAHERSHQTSQHDPVSQRIRMRFTYETVQSHRDTHMRTHIAV